MGKINQGILGGISGTVGPVIGGSWKGQNYLRSKPTSVANPNTVGQQEQRTKFTSAVYWAQQLLGAIIQPFWNKMVSAMSGYNWFMSVNTGNFDSSGNPIYGSIEMCKGTLERVNGVNIVSDQSLGRHTVTWVDNSGTGNALGADKVTIVIYNESQGYFKTYVQVADRSNASYAATDTDIIAANVIHAYVFLNRTGNEALASMSFYQSTTAIP